MKNKYSLIAILIVITLLSGCSQKGMEFGKPTATVDDVTVQDVSMSNLELDVRVIVNNPNPVGAQLTKVVFDMYYLKDGQQNYLGHGEKQDIDIRKEGETTITIPTTIDNKQAISALVELAKEGSVTLKLSGSAYIDMKATNFEVPFEENEVISLSSEISEPKTIGEETTEQTTPTNAPKSAPKAQISISDASDTSGGIFKISHQGGDTINCHNTLIKVYDQGEDLVATMEYTNGKFTGGGLATGVTDSNFEVGDVMVVSGSSVVSSGDIIRVKIIDTASNQIILDGEIQVWMPKTTGEQATKKTSNGINVLCVSGEVDANKISSLEITVKLREDSEDIDLSDLVVIYNEDGTSHKLFYDRPGTSFSCTSIQDNDNSY
ncbi:MAG: LEA type 2 family protein, partial [Archaeoglobaceae archaeon]